MLGDWFCRGCMQWHSWDVARCARRDPDGCRCFGRWDCCLFSCSLGHRRLWGEWGGFDALVLGADPITWEVLCDGM